MFKLLKEKLTGWFKGKKEETKETEKDKEKINKKKRNERTKEVDERKNFAEKEPREKDAEKILEEVETIEKKKSEEKKKTEKEKTAEGDGFFAKLARKISNSKLEKEELNEMFMEFELTLLENNVSLEVVDRIKETLSVELVGKQFKKSEVEEKILESLRKSVEEVLIEPENLFDLIKKKNGVFVILFFGINGGGKTTSVAKISYALEKRGISCVLAAADTFRAASIEQLEAHAKKIGVPIVKHDYMADPSAVGYDAIQYAKKNRKKVVLIDTAGRMYTKTNLMKEMEKIVRVTNPDLKIFVGESITGNDVTQQAKMFQETAGIDGIILSKADVDEKAGAILSVSYVTKKPIFYLGTGQNYKDLKEFKKKDVLKNLGLN